jgi:hypothetical protein
MQLDFLTTVFLTAMSLLGGGALVLSYLHWKEWKLQKKLQQQRDQRSHRADAKAAEQEARQ